MDEAALLAHIYARASDSSGAITVGPGDDCAIIDLGGERPALLTTDQLIEGRHFEAGTPIEHSARKAVGRSVSDIAACAGEPVCTLATCAIPSGYEHAQQLFDAVHEAARAFGAPCAGGDIAAAAPGAALHLTTTVVGLAHRTRGAVLRSAAPVGGVVMVSGVLGGSFNARLDRDGVPHHLSFTPRTAIAQSLAGDLGDQLCAMMDISDGLGVDAGRLALASGVSMRIDADSIPITPELEGAADAIDRAVGDGEDYELLCVVDPCAVTEATQLGLTPIGVVTAPDASTPAGAVALSLNDGSTRRIEHAGHVHRSEPST